MISLFLYQLQHSHSFSVLIFLLFNPLLQLPDLVFQLLLTGERELVLFIYVVSKSLVQYLIVPRVNCSSFILLSIHIGLYRFFFRVSSLPFVHITLWDTRLVRTRCHAVVFFVERYFLWCTFWASVVSEFLDVSKVRWSPLRHFLNLKYKFNC